MHLGGAPQSGHCRTLSLECAGRMWWTDDGRVPQGFARSDISLLFRSAYIVLLHPDGQS